MAASRQPVGSGALESCGLNLIVDALKLLLSPGGEKARLGAALARDSHG